MKDYDGDKVIDQIDMIKWDDAENDSLGFFEWKAAKHPVYGDIEIGGFDPKFFSQNPPAKHLETWIRNEAKFNIEMANYLPELAWENVEVKKIKSYKSDSTDYQLIVSFRNNGKLPTALKQAHLVKIVTDDRVVVDFDTTGNASGKPGYKVIVEEKKTPPREGRGRFGDDERPSVQSKYSNNVANTQGGSVTTSIFKVRFYGRTELKGKVSVLSTRGGILKDKEFVIK
jgi:hypothetical protein